jgi:hypothetical protein
MRVLSPVRAMRNYILPVNIVNGYVRKDWPDEAIYVGKEGNEAMPAGRNGHGE